MDTCVNQSIISSLPALDAQHMHSHHHRLVVPYAYGALYNHPLEALLLDTLGGVVTLYASGMRYVQWFVIWSIGWYGWSLST